MQQPLALAIAMGMGSLFAGEEPDEQETVTVLPGERLPPSALGEGLVESMEAVLHRMEHHPAPPRVNHRLRNDEQGRWEIPSPRHAEFPHSGQRYLTVEWGDTRMGIGFGEPVDVRGVWVTGHKSPAVWAPAIRVVGYRDGEPVGETGWFEDVDATPSWMAIDLGGVDRIEVLAEPAYEGAGYYGLDDLSFARTGAAHAGGAEPREEVLDFEDLAFRQVLTGSGYAGLGWETGTGDFSQEPRTVHAPKTPAGAPGARPEAGPEAGAQAAAAPGLGTLPTLVEDFDGPRLLDPGAFFVPPDSCGTVGPNHYVSVVNEHISVYDKLTKQRLVSTDLQSFFNTGGTAGDPRVVYDSHDDRWVVTASTFGTQVRLAYSLSGDPTGSWFKTAILVSTGADAGTFPDFPTTGVDEDGIYFAAFMVGNNDTMSVFAVDKAPLLSGTPGLGTVTAWRQLPFEGSIQPAVSWDAAPGEYLVSQLDPTTLRIRRVDPPLSAPTLVEVGTVGVIAGNVPPLAPALGSTVDLFTVDSRLWNAVQRNGSLWTAHTVDANGRAAVNWYELDPAGLGVIQQGTVDDPVRHYFFPSISVSSAGNVALGFSGSSPSLFAGCWYTGRTASDPPGEMADPVEYKAGEASYNIVGNGLNRWGDYSMTAADPVDDTLWTIQEYATAPSDGWGTRIARLDFPCGAVVAYCTAGTSASGCQATLSALGTPSATAPSGFTVTAATVEGDKRGIFFWGTSGRQASPWGNGSSYRCVLPPTKRGGVLPKTGTPGACDGTFAQDLNARWAQNPNQNPGAGALVQTQLWYRDPQNTSNQSSSLSDALEFLVCP